jgi:hypothetical protein
MHVNDVVFCVYWVYHRYDRDLDHPWLVTDALQYWADLSRANDRHRALVTYRNAQRARIANDLGMSSASRNENERRLSDISSEWATLNDWNVVRWSSRIDLNLTTSSPYEWWTLIKRISPTNPSIESSRLYQQLYWQYYRGVEQPPFDGRYYSLTRIELYCSLQSESHRRFRQCLTYHGAMHRTPDTVAAPHPLQAPPIGNDAVAAAADAALKAALVH